MLKHKLLFQCQCRYSNSHEKHVQKGICDSEFQRLRLHQCHAKSHRRGFGEQCWRRQKRCAESHFLLVKRSYFIPKVDEIQRNINCKITLPFSSRWNSETMRISRSGFRFIAWSWTSNQSKKFATFHPRFFRFSSTYFTICNFFQE